VLQHLGSNKTILGMKIILTKVSKIWVIAISLCINYTVNAQSTEGESIEFSGSVDTYFRTNLSGGDKLDAPASSFANLNGFALGMVNVKAEQSTSQGGFVADLVFGPRGTDAVFASPYYSATGNIVNQLYAYWNANEKLTLTLGNFNTFLGYEVISPVDNFHYSTSYLFSYGPFSHTGLKADYVLSDDHSLMVAIMNPTDLTEMNDVNLYTYGLQYGFKDTYFNFLYGKQAVDADATFQADITGSYELSDKFSLGVNASYNETMNAGGFYGVALYPALAIKDGFDAGLRVEYFKELEAGGVAYGADNSVIDATVTASYTTKDLRLIAELRLDQSSTAQFNSMTSDQLSSFILAAVYSF
jgi:hypothetical protein